MKSEATGAAACKATFDVEERASAGFARALDAHRQGAIGKPSASVVPAAPGQGLFLFENHVAVRRAPAGWLRRGE
jgi:hypothetical protein